MEPVTPAARTAVGARFWKSEDSGYHTSHTPGSFEYSELSNGIYDQIPHDIIEDKESVNHERKYKRYKSTPLPSHKLNESSSKRRGVKRAYQENVGILECSFISVATPTSIIAGGIERLKVNDSLDVSLSPLHIDNDDTGYNKYFSFSDYTQTLSYPTTPVKKICRTNESPLTSPLRPINNLCCPPRRSAKKLSFNNNSLPGEIIQLHSSSTSKSKPHLKAARKIFAPEVKFDIIDALYQKVCCMPAIINIFSYLSNEDIFNFSLVNSTWMDVCEKVSEAKQKKQEYQLFINNTKENYENRNNLKLNQHESHTDRDEKSIGSLKDIYNTVNSRKKRNSPVRTPPSTPRTMRFRKFTKSASLDTRLQLSCIRCNQPSKVTEEPSGEEWACCVNSLCSYQFCRYCKCERHPGKVCFQYDLTAPSPSKRKKSTSLVGTKKSKKNLRRLL